MRRRLESIPVATPTRGRDSQDFTACVVSVELVITLREPGVNPLRLFGQRGPGLEVSRDGVEVGTAPGSFARDSTNAISWSPNSWFSTLVVRRSDVTRKPALLANPIARPFSVLTQ
jgi:hypothetical protein